VADTAAEDIRIKFKYFYRINREPLQICRGFSILVQCN